MIGLRMIQKYGARDLRPELEITGCGTTKSRVESKLHRGEPSELLEGDNLSYKWLSCLYCEKKFKARARLGPHQLKCPKKP